MIDKAFELFKAQYGEASRDALLRLAYDWQTQCQLIAKALDHIQQEHISLLAVNDLCCDVIIAHELQEELTHELLQPYTEKRVVEYVEGCSIAAGGIRKHAELFLSDTRAKVARDAGKESGKNRAAELEQRNNVIKEDAKKLESNGTLPHEIASKLAHRHNLSAKQIRIILKPE